MVAPAQVIQGLRPFTWRGLTVLIQSAPVDFAHAQAVRKYPYVDGEGHDWTGREAHKVKVRMFFLETLDPGAFTKKWPVWRKALSDGSPGIMEHPILGKFRAVVDNGTISYAAETTAGVIVDCSFSEDTEAEVQRRLDRIAASPTSSATPSRPSRTSPRPHRWPRTSTASSGPLSGST